MHCSIFLASRSGLWEASHPRVQGKSPTPIQPMLLPLPWLSLFHLSPRIMQQRRATCRLPYTMTYGIGSPSGSFQISSFQPLALFLQT